MRPSRARLGVCVALAGVLCACCGKKPDHVVVGIGLASNAYDALRTAVDEINADGGIGGVRFQLTGMDPSDSADVYDPPTIIKTAGRFVRNPDLVAVVGHSDSNATLSAAPIYNKEGVPLLVTIATNPAITNIGSWTYRLCLSDAAQGPALADYVVNDWHKRRIAIFYVNDDYGRALAQLFEQRVHDLGAQVVAAVMHHNTLAAADKEMIQSALADLARQSPAPDLIALFQRVDGAAWTLRAIHDADLQVDRLGSDNLAQYQLIEREPVLTEGLRVSQFFQIDSTAAHADTFVRKLRAITGKDPDYAQAFAYDAIYLLRDAILSGHYSRPGVKAYLDHLIERRTVVPGVAGPFVLGSDHDARRPLYIAEVRDHRFVVIKAVGSVAGRR